MTRLQTIEWQMDKNCLRSAWNLGLGRVNEVFMVQTDSTWWYRLMIVAGHRRMGLLWLVGAAASSQKYTPVQKQCHTELEWSVSTSLEHNRFSVTFVENRRRTWMERILDGTVLGLHWKSPRDVDATSRVGPWELIYMYELKNDPHVARGSISKSCNAMRRL